MTPPPADANEVVTLWPSGHPAGPPGTGLEASETTDGIERIRNVEVPSLVVFRPPAGAAMGTGLIVCPGGGYARLAMSHEGWDVARWFAARGVTVAVLKYRMETHRHPEPLQDVLRAMRILRARAVEFGVHPDRIGVLGFSAGGHLASCAATLWGEPEGRGGDRLDEVTARPDFGVLAYPVISLVGPAAHTGSRRNLLGPEENAELAEALSTERRVAASTPPTLLLHAHDDRAVPVENSLLFHAALREAGVATALHLFERGGHGFGMKATTGEAAAWPGLVAAWIEARGLGDGR